MARKASIKSSKLLPPLSRKERLTKSKAASVLRAERRIRPAPDVDPIEFAKAFAPFASDMDLLSSEEQQRFQSTLRAYLAGVIDREEWRQVFGAFSALKRASIPPEPPGYWGGRYRTYGFRDDGW